MSEWQVIDVIELQDALTGDAVQYKEFLNARRCLVGYIIW
jgi:hypothetical protein